MFKSLFSLLQFVVQILPDQCSRVPQGFQINKDLNQSCCLFPTLFKILEQTLIKNFVSVNAKIWGYQLTIPLCTCLIRRILRRLFHKKVNEMGTMYKPKENRRYTGCPEIPRQDFGRRF